MTGLIIKTTLPGFLITNPKIKRRYFQIKKIDILKQSIASFYIVKKKYVYKH